MNLTPPYCEPGPSTSRRAAAADSDHRPADVDQLIPTHPYPPYHFDINAVGPSTSRAAAADDVHGPADVNRKIHYPPYHFDISASGPSTSRAADDVHRPVDVDRKIQYTPYHFDINLPGPSTSRAAGDIHRPVDVDRKIQYPPYHYDITAARPSTSRAADDIHRPVDVDREIQYPPYHFDINVPGPSTSRVGDGDLQRPVHVDQKIQYPPYHFNITAAGPSTSRATTADVVHRPVDLDRKIQYPPYHYNITGAGPSTSRAADDIHRPVDVDQEIQYPPYHFDINVPGPSTSRVGDGDLQRPVHVDQKIQYPPYHFDMTAAGPSTSRAATADNVHQPPDVNRKIQYPPYHYDINMAGPSTSASSLTYPLPAWPDSQSYPSYLAMAVNAAQPTSYIYPPTSSLRLPPTEQIPPNCLDWTINPSAAPHRQFKTTLEPLFTLGYNSTISENWMEGDKGLQYSIKNFTFSTKRITNSLNEASVSCQIVEYDSLLVSIPQALEGDYHYYVWPASPVLAWIIWEHRMELPGKKILEVGSGTSLPGIVAAKCGAIVTLTDDPTIPGTIKHIQKCCYMNGLYPEQIRVLGLQWGYFFRETLNIGQFDLIIGSDCFYEPNMFEDLIATISYLLDSNPLAKFMTTYHERDPEYGIDELAAKWKLNCTHKSLEDLGQNNELDIYELMKGNDIHLIELTRKVVKKTEKNVK